MKADLKDWITKKLTATGWSISEVARRGDISPSGLDRLYNGDREPGLKTCLGIAQAFNEPLTSVLRLAGLIPPAQEQNRVTDELYEIACLLSDEDAECLLQVARKFLQAEQAEEDRNCR
jgi:transcriptional regulator with XRE-family HTH domain